MSLLSLCKILNFFFAKKNMDPSYIESPFLGTQNIMKDIN